jgi:hypothetical protein
MLAAEAPQRLRQGSTGGAFLPLESESESKPESGINSVPETTHGNGPGLGPGGGGPGGGFPLLWFQFQPPTPTNKLVGAGFVDALFVGTSVLHVLCLVTVVGVVCVLGLGVIHAAWRVWDSRFRPARKVAKTD